MPYKFRNRNKTDSYIKFYKSKDRLFKGKVWELQKKYPKWSKATIEGAVLDSLVIVYQNVDWTKPYNHVINYWLLCLKSILHTIYRSKKRKPFIHMIEEDLEKYGNKR